MLCVTLNRFGAGREGQTRIAGEALDHQPPIVVAGVETGPDGCRADVQLLQLLDATATSWAPRLMHAE